MGAQRGGTQLREKSPRGGALWINVIAAMVHLLIGSVLRFLDSRKLDASTFVPPHHLRAPSPAAHHEKQ